MKKRFFLLVLESCNSLEKTRKAHKAACACLEDEINAENRFDLTNTFTLSLILNVNIRITRMFKIEKSTEVRQSKILLNLNWSKLLQG